MFFFFAPDITPYVVLYHYDLPQVLQDQYNGWLSPRVVLVFTINTTISFLHQIYKTHSIMHVVPAISQGRFHQVRGFLLQDVR
jgi:hypothetical protein